MPSNLLWRLLPLSLFVLLAWFLYQGLFLNPKKLPSVLINKKAPELTLPLLSIDNEQESSYFSLRQMQGKVWLLNVWASWCQACQIEHAVIMDIAASGVAVIGLDYKDGPSQGRAWLKQYGNPYQRVLSDVSGRAAIDWGVYGAPETFVIDAKGMIRYKHVGPITQTLWRDTLQPIIEKISS